MITSIGAVITAHGLQIDLSSRDCEFFPCSKTIAEPKKSFSNLWFMPWLYKYTREFFEWELRPWIIFAACAVPLLASAGVKIGAACRFAESPLHNIVLKDVNLHSEQN